MYDISSKLLYTIPDSDSIDEIHRLQPDSIYKYIRYTQ